MPLDRTDCYVGQQCSLTAASIDRTHCCICRNHGLLRLSALSAVLTATSISRTDCYVGQQGGLPRRSTKLIDCCVYTTDRTDCCVCRQPEPWIRLMRRSVFVRPRTGTLDPAYVYECLRSAKGRNLGSGLCVGVSSFGRGPKPWIWLVCRSVFGRPRARISGSGLCVGLPGS
jgi:hypothetical protein